MIHNSKEGQWESATLAQQIADDASRTRLIATLTQFIATNHFQGVCIDFEEVPASSQRNLLRFMQELHAEFQQRNWIVTQCAPFDDEEWNYRAYAAANDRECLVW